MVTKPMPSMPIGFGAMPMFVYRAAYFDSYPGVRFHGIDHADGRAVVSSPVLRRTLNRGVRIGTSIQKWSKRSTV